MGLPTAVRIGANGRQPITDSSRLRSETQTQNENPASAGSAATLAMIFQAASSFVSADLGAD